MTSHPFGNRLSQRGGLNLLKMKYSVLKWGLLLFFCFGNILALEAEDTVKISISINYAIDLSDTYGGGNLFSGESTFALSWFGLKGSFGHLNSQYYSLVEVPYSDLGQTLELYIPEISFMSLGSLSLFVRPVSKKWITMDVVFGASMGRAKSFFIKDIEYEYSLHHEHQQIFSSLNTLLQILLIH